MRIMYDTNVLISMILFPSERFNRLHEIVTSKHILVISTYSAIVSNVDVFITGDKDFKDVDIPKPEIVTPSEFLDLYDFIVP